MEKLKIKRYAAIAIWAAIAIYAMLVAVSMWAAISSAIQRFICAKLT